MNQAKNRALSGSTICLLFFTMLLQDGCMVAATLRGEQGKDVSSVKLGISREEAENVLGSPIREWVTSSNIRYCVYVYDAGIPPSASEAAAIAFLDIISLGLVELHEVTGRTHLGDTSKKIGRVYNQIAVAYDTGGIIVGVFDRFGDFDVLPPDGRADK